LSPDKNNNSSPKPNNQGQSRPLHEDRKFNSSEGLSKSSTSPDGTVTGTPPNTGSNNTKK